MGNVTRTFQFTPEQAFDLFRLQGLANDAMSTDWRTSTNNEIAYYRASYVEAAEALQSYGYKWWKKETPNEFHVKMELIDILHFVISDELRDFYKEIERQGIELTDTDRVNSLMAEHATLYFNEWYSTHHLFEDTLEEATVQSLIDQFMYDTLENLQGSWPMLALLFEKLEMSPNAVYGFYVGKNVLNRFRDEFGQKEGKYHRTWHEGLDDNDVLINHIVDSDREGKTLTEESIYTFLKELYAVVLEKHYNTTMEAVLGD